MFSWVMAGGVAGGGILVGALTIGGYVAPGLQLLAAPVLFLVGSFLGATHGAILAVVGRAEHATCADATRCALYAGLLALPALGAGWILTSAIAVTAALTKEWRLSWACVAGLGWVIGLVLCGWAAREGWHALRRALARWPQNRVGSILVTSILVVLSIVSLQAEPEIIGTGLRLNGVGAVVVAVMVTLWVGVPLVWLVLRVAGSWISPHGGGGEAGT